MGSEPSYFVSSKKLNFDFIGTKILEKEKLNITTPCVSAVDARFGAILFGGIFFAVL